MMLVQNFLLFWGVLGWTANQIFAPHLVDPARFVLPALMVAGCGGLVLTIGTGTLLSRFTPQDETFAVTKRELEGRSGIASATITERMGAAHVRDAGRTLHQLPARVRPGSELIPRGASLVVVEYEPDDDFYWVRQWSPD